VPIEKKPPKPRASQKKQPPRAPKVRAAKAKRTAGGVSPMPAPGKSAVKLAAKRSAAKPSVTKPAAKRSLRSVVLDALDDMKALEVKVLDVRGLTDISDYMVIASGTSDRHVRSVAQRVVEKTKEAGFRPHGVEGQQDGDWVHRARHVAPRARVLRVGEAVGHDGEARRPRLRFAAMAAERA
jgi:ribosome silencing factor RsfS/YbeB/iojap